MRKRQKEEIYLFIYLFLKRETRIFFFFFGEGGLLLLFLRMKGAACLGEKENSLGPINQISSNLLI